MAMASSAAGFGAVLLTRVELGSVRLARRRSFRFFSSTPFAASAGGLPPPDVPRLAETARISLSSQEMQEFAPKIRQVVDWFGQLQAFDLESIEPSLRAGTEDGTSRREDLPEIFENREAIIAAVPIYDHPYIKVPKVLSKE